MRLSNKPMLFLFMLSICVTCSQAANHYVRQGANGNGNDWSNAYGQLPSTLVRGDTYYIADGTYPGYTFDDAGSQWITIKKATVADHGTDTGWQSSYGDGQAVFGGLQFSGNYFVFDGVTGGGPGRWSSGHGFKIAQIISSGSFQLVTLSAGANHITISHTEITALNTDDTNKQAGIKGVFGNSNLVFSYNNIHTLFGVHFHMGDWNNVIIEYNHMANNRNTPDWHSEGISSIGTNDNIVIRHNIWDNIEGTAVIAGVNTGTSNKWKIYGNIFSRSVTPIYYYYEPSPSTNHQTMNNLEFYNNVITGIRASQGGVAINQGSNNKIYNNIWYDNNINQLMISGIKNSNYFSKNIRTDGCSPQCNKDTEGASGDSNAQITSTNPFRNWNTLMEAANADFRLVEPTNQGVALPSPYNIDALGNIRGADGSWDIGAYEYASNQAQTCIQQSGMCCQSGQTCSGVTKTASDCTTCCTGTCQSTCIPGDLNCDKKVDIFDLVLVAQNYGKTSGFDARADANKDGRIDIFDLVIVAQNYGK